MTVRCRPAAGPATTGASGTGRGATTGPRGDAGRVAVYAVGVLVLALVAAALLLAAGASLPPLGVCAVLALPLTLCMNRFVFFPNEVGATAEAAALFTAILAFRTESPVLGPVLLALLVGVLDGRHWERRAFLRMSYNSGSQALTVFVVASALIPIVRATSTSTTGLLVASVLTAMLYVAVETTFGVVLVVLLGEPMRSAVRHQLPTNALAVPLALFGAAVALVVTATNWWLGTLLLLPSAFVPELVLVRMRRRPWPRAVMGVVVAGLAAATVVVDRASHGRQLSVAVGLATVGLILAADVGLPPRRAALPCVGLLLALSAGSLSTPWLVTLCAAGIVLTLAAGGRSTGAIWSVPLTISGVTIASAARVATIPPGVSTVVGVVIVLAAVATWGPLPWPSRVVGVWGARHGRGSPTAVLVGACAVCVAAAGWSVVGTAPVGGRVALAAAAAALACAAAHVRQWRFAPAARRRDGMGLGFGVVVLAGALPADAAGATPLGAAACVTAAAIAAIVAFGGARSVRRAHRRVAELSLRGGVGLGSGALRGGAPSTGDEHQRAPEEHQTAGDQDRRNGVGRAGERE